MGTTRINHNHGVVLGSKVEVHLPDLRILRIPEIDGNNTTHGTGHLVHQSTGLTEKIILSILTCHGQYFRGNPAIIEK